ncbi:glycosyltransferase [Nocardioides caeni]|uniref:Glycosyltransferase family 2 protein n=1 Tax=Nocardioides caeni TaxID=574700 RepID=A0A4S8N6B3_9ACTN|nr:glycosyltransferase family 2 protein [Nocardioides caeni]THV10449.1 glycosyltransferase family 2 protein [Nocardioides caeni]
MTAVIEPLHDLTGSRSRADRAVRPSGVVGHHRPWRQRLWRWSVVGYAGALLAFAVSLKAGDALAGNAVLMAYGALLAAYVLTRIVLAGLYRPDRTLVADADLPSLVIAVPAFNEAEHVEDTIDALFRVDYPADRLRVIVVDDGSSDDTWERIRTSSARHPQLDGLRFSRNRGKRAAMAAAIRAAAGADLVVFVDSDSVLEPQALRELVKPFIGDAEGRVGAVTGHADVQNPGTNLLTRLQQVRYFAAFRVIKAAESRFGAVICASGCFSAYRRTALLEVLDGWENQRFLGQEATFGDDRALTNALLSRGREVRYQSTAISATLVPDQWHGFLRQQLRWKKSWLRETLHLVRFAWRWPVLASFAVYASVVFQLAGPLVALYSLVLRPVFGDGSPWLYLVGLQVVAVLYGLLYAGVRRSPHWWGGIAYAFAYSAVISWQIYWAMLTQRNTSWGTRAAAAQGQDEPLAIADVVGEPGDAGLPLRCAPGRRTSAAVGVLLDERPPVPDWDAASRRDWAIGLLALPVSAVPVMWWLLGH